MAHNIINYIMASLLFIGAVVLVMLGLAGLFFFLKRIDDGTTDIPCVDNSIIGRCGLGCLVGMIVLIFGISCIMIYYGYKAIGLL